MAENEINNNHNNKEEADAAMANLLAQMKSHFEAELN